MNALNQGHEFVAVSTAMRTLSCYLSSIRSIIGCRYLPLFIPLHFFACFKSHSHLASWSSIVLSIEQYQTYEDENQFLCSLERISDTSDRTYPKVVLILLT